MFAPKIKEISGTVALDPQGIPIINAAGILLVDQTKQTLKPGDNIHIIIAKISSTPDIEIDANDNSEEHN